MRDAIRDSSEFAVRGSFAVAVPVVDATSSLGVESALTTSGSMTAAFMDIDGVGVGGVKDDGAGSANEVKEGLAAAAAAKARSDTSALSVASPWTWALVARVLSGLIEGTAV